MDVMRFVSQSGDGIEKCVWGGTCMVSYCQTCLKPCLAQHKSKRLMVMG